MMRRTVLIFLMCVGLLHTYAQYCPYEGDCGDQLLLVDINGYVNNSGTCDFYTDYSGTVAMYAEPGSNFIVNVAWQNFSDAAVYMFFDWDENETWDPATEMYVLGTGAATNASTQVVVPPTVASGAEVKVRAMLATIYEAPDPCTGPPAGVFGVSEVEDYTVEIVDELPVSPGYCEANGNAGGHGGTDDCDNTADELDTYITGVTFTDEFTNTGTSCGETRKGYTDFTDITAVVKEGDTYEIVVDLFSEGNAYENVKAWIDWNGDQTFDPGTEELVTTNLIGENKFTFTGTVDATFTEGYTGPSRLRVLGYWNYVDAVYTPCGITAIGEVEDYSVFIGDPPPNCAVSFAPVDGSTELCQKGTTLSWEAPSSGEAPSGYKISIGTDNPPTTLEDNTDLGTATSYNFNSEDLDPGTTYYWQVVPYNDNGDANGCVINSFTTVEDGDPVVSFEDENGMPTTVYNACTGVAFPFEGIITRGLEPYTYSWIGDDTDVLNRTDTSAVIATTNAPGSNTLSLEVTDDNGCAGSATVTLETETNANAGIVAGNTEVCSGEDLVLTATDTHGDLQWQQISDGVWVDISNANQPSYRTPSVQAGSQYRLVASTANCSDTSDVLNITVFPKPEPPVITTSNGLEGFCQGEELTLSSNQTNNSWSTGSTDASITVGDAGTYSVSFVDENGCESEATSIEVSEFPVPVKPVIDQAMGSNAYACGGYPFELTTSNNADFDITWVGLNGETETSATATEDGEVQLTFTNEFGCSNSSELVNVQEKALPSTPVITTEDNSTAFCEGETLALTAQTDDGTSLVWNDDAGITGTTITVDEAGEYFVTATDAFGCVAQSENLTVTKNSLPDVPELITQDDETEFCDNGNPFITTSSSTVYWNGDASNVTDTLWVSVSGTYFATAVSEAGCEQESESLNLTVNAAPEVPVVTNDNGTLISTVDDQALQYQWFSQEGSEVSGETDPLFTNAPEGSFYIEVTDPETGCSSRSDIVNDIQYEGSINNLKVFPNPVERGAFVSITSDKTVRQLMVLDASGRQVLVTQGSALNTASLSKGVYVLLMQFGENSIPVKTKLVVE